MRIVLVADHAYINGGQAKVSLESAIGLARRGHEVVLFAAVGPADPRLAEAGVRTVILGQTDVTKARSLASFGVQWLWNAPAAARLRDLVAESDPRDTVIHVHAWAKALSPSIGPVLRAAAAPVVYTAHEYYLACPNGGFYDYPVAAPCHRTPNGLACLTHNCDSRTYPRKLMRVARHALMRRTGLVEGIDAMITISELQRQALAPYLPASTRTYDVPNPVDVEPLGHRAGPPGDFVFVGRLSPEKGPGVFAEAARLAGVRAVFAGDGPARAELEARHPEALFLGWQSPDQVKAVLRGARALVFPSVWYEGQPLTVLEALALGTPVLVSNVCAGREAVQHGENGFWFRSNDPQALANAMSHLVNDATAMRMGRAAYDRFWAEPLTLERHLDGLERVYREVSGQEAEQEAGPRPRPMRAAG
ncbi:glycosyltransferase family 4 protein [Methylobacterium aquaticum]|uniref:glycosyltransferase family 4 protein n=1 Tax=Methylobacterium aquaticum TaxID=270351 RepID=UPI003D179484